VAWISGSDVVTVRKAPPGGPQNRKLDVLVGTQRRFFEDNSHMWQDYNRKSHAPLLFALLFIKQHVFKGDDYFVHFERLYDIDENAGILKLSFGAFEKCEHKYLIFNDNKIQYFPYEALPIRQNLKSHKKIEEFLNA